MEPETEGTAPTPTGTGPNLLGITDAQAEAVKAVAGLGTTLVAEGGQLARYMGRVLGTAPEDAVGLVLGDPLHFVRTVIARALDQLVSKIFERRGVTDTQPVSPSVAIPLLRAAYDESRPELQQLWAELIAAAMDPKRSGRVRLSFIDTLKRFDPLDALVLRTRYTQSGDLSPNALEFSMKSLNTARDEIEISIGNLIALNCIFRRGADRHDFQITPYGRELMGVCSD
jgi:hypothetical protein